MLESLINSTYSALDRDPHEQIAFRARHPDGLVWSVRDRVLTASTEAGTPLTVIGLRNKTLSQIITTLVSVGCTIVYRNNDLDSRAADSLLASTGMTAQSNGDSFRVYDSLLWSTLDAYAVVLEDASADVDAGIRQVYLRTSEDDFLDIWGSYFGLPREQDEGDDAYRLRILVETLRPRVNRYAIEQTIFNITGKRVTLYEPWVDIFILSASDLSGGHKLHDGDFYTHNVVQPKSSDAIDWRQPLAILNRNRPAGTIILPQAFAPDGRAIEFQAGAPVTIHASRHDTWSNKLDSIDPTALGYLSLSNYQVLINHKMALLSSISIGNEEGVNAQQTIGRPYTVSLADITLSDGGAFGELNFKFGHTDTVNTTVPAMLSGDNDQAAYPLSDREFFEVVNTYQQVFRDLRATRVVIDVTAVITSSRLDIRSDTLSRVTPRVWSGAWSDKNWRTERVYSARIDTTVL